MGAGRNPDPIRFFAKLQILVLFLLLNFSLRVDFYETAGAILATFSSLLQSGLCPTPS